jgi:DNA-binding MarR family transcriptional regulator
MTLEQLRIFVAVAEREHVTQAAQALNLAQSAASHAIAALEARYETKLFDRVGRRIELTEAGAAFLAEARVILAQVNRAEIAAMGKQTREKISHMLLRARDHGKQISLVVLTDHFGAFVGQLGNAPFALVIHAVPLVLENRSFFHSGRGIASRRGQAAFTAS